MRRRQLELIVLAQAAVIKDLKENAEIDKSIKEELAKQLVEINQIKEDANIQVNYVQRQILNNFNRGVGR